VGRGLPPIKDVIWGSKNVGKSTDGLFGMSVGSGKSSMPDLLSSVNSLHLHSSH